MFVILFAGALIVIIRLPPSHVAGGHRLWKRAVAATAT